MGRITSTGFELGSATNGVEFAAVFSTSGGTVSVQSTTARSGTYAGKCIISGGTGSNAGFELDFSSIGSGRTAYARVYLRIHTYTNATNPAVVFVDSAFNNGAEFLINSTGVISLNKWSNDVQIGSNGPTLSLDTWYRLEMSYVINTHTVTGYVDGVQFASGVGDSPTSIAALEVNIDELAGGTHQTVGEYYWDDFAVNDDQGSFQNGLPGAGKIIHLKPSAAGDANSFATQTGGTAGAGNNFTRVNEVPPNDATSFNGSSTLNEEDLFNVDDSGIGSGDTVNVVAIGGRFRNSTADTTGAFKFEVEKTGSGTKTQSSAIIPNSTTWRTNAKSSTVLTYPITTYQDPDSSAWTKTTLDSMQIGYIDTAAPGTGGRRNDISNVWALTDYTPATDLSVNVNDTSAVTDSIGRMIESYVNKSDSSAVTESVNLAFANDLVVSNSSAVTDSVVILSIENVNVSETSTITESVIILITELFITVNDSSAVTENTQTLLTSFINKSESSTITELILTSGDSSVNVSDSSAVTENIKLLDEENVNVSNSTGVTDSVILLNSQNVNVTDGSTVTDSDNLLIPTLLINLNDTVILDESASLFAGGGAFTTDNIGVDEFTNLLIPTLFASTSNTSAVTESLAESITSFVNVSNISAVTESVALLPDLLINVSNTTTITESIGKSVISFIQAFELTEVDEDILLSESDILLSFSDTINYQENVKARLDPDFNIIIPYRLLRGVRRVLRGARTNIGARRVIRGSRTTTRAPRRFR